MIFTKDKNYGKKILNSVSRFLVFFLIMAFVITCNFYLFLSSVQMEETEIRAAAPITFLNVLLLTIIFFLID